MLCSSRRPFGLSFQHSPVRACSLVSSLASPCAARSTRPQTDVVALNGGSFVALKDKPGPCPGSGWQLVASQGKRGVAGEKGRARPSRPEGDAGASGATICDWKIDRASYVATPVMSDGSEGPPLELRGLFEQFFSRREDDRAGEADQSRGEREPARTMAPEVVEARIVLRVAQLRLLAAWTRCSVPK